MSPINGVITVVEENFPPHPFQRLFCLFQLICVSSLKDQNKDSDIKWSIFKKSSGYSIVSKSCNLCLLEKLVISNFKEEND